MRVKSNYLEKELEVDVFEAMEDGETINIISHETLENIIYNKLDASLGVSCEYKALLINPEHSVFFCTIKDMKGRSVQAVGEVTPATLETEIAKNFPVLTAAKRAFDRAAKLYLGLEVGGKILSDAEADLTVGAANNGTEVVDLAKEAEKAARTAQETSNEGGNAGTPPKQNVAPAAPQGRAGGSAAKNNAAPAQPTMGDPGSVMCEVGQFRGKKMTIADVYRDSPGYVGWIAKKYNASTPEQIAAKEAAKAFLAAVEGGK